MGGRTTVTPSDGTPPSASGSSVRRWGRRIRSAATRLWREPRLRGLRWILAIGLVIRLVLIPISSWGQDTPAFVLANLDFLTVGSPYATHVYYNPPLAVYLASPFFLGASWLQSPSSMLVFEPSLLPAASATSMVSALVPSPLALVALKLPLLISDLATAGLLFRVVGQGWGVTAATRAAGVWWLNPVVLWASAVHGETDTLAALFLVVWVAATAARRPFGAGCALALAAFAKFYPVALLPLAVVLWIPSLRRAPGSASGWRPLGLFCGGLVLATAAFLPLLVPLAGVLPATVAGGAYGGLSLLVVYHGAAHALASAPAPLGPSFWVAVLELVAVGTVAATAVLAWRQRPGGWMSGRPAGLAVAALVVVTAAIVARSSPQSENVVGLAGLAAAGWPVLDRRVRTAAVAVFAAAFALYMVLLTPLAYFLPLATDLGPRAVRTMSSVLLAYLQAPGPWSQGLAWELVGVAGGLALLSVLVAGLAQLSRMAQGEPGGRPE